MRLERRSAIRACLLVALATLPFTPARARAEQGAMLDASPIAMSQVATHLPFERAAGADDVAGPAASRGVSGFTLRAIPAPAFVPGVGADGYLAKRDKPTAKVESAEAIAEVFTAERARILLRSLMIPGWGQATAGRLTSARVFGVIETGIWGTFTAFRVQEQLRRGTYERSARLQAGIDLRGRDEEFRRIVGGYLSSDQYNQFVVYRDAANLYYDNPVAYRKYISEHELHGKDTWSWENVDDLLRYRGQRKNAQRAAIRANTMLAIAVVDRLVSALDAARGQHAKDKREATPRSWNLEVAPADPADATAFRIGVRTRF